jgi:hypothetical protein
LANNSGACFPFEIVALTKSTFAASSLAGRQKRPFGLNRSGMRTILEPRFTFSVP